MLTRRLSLRSAFALALALAATLPTVVVSAALVGIFWSRLATAEHAELGAAARAGQALIEAAGERDASLANQLSQRASLRAALQARQGLTDLPAGGGSGGPDFYAVYEAGVGLVASSGPLLPPDYSVLLPTLRAAAGSLRGRVLIAPLGPGGEPLILGLATVDPARTPGALPARRLGLVVAGTALDTHFLGGLSVPGGARLAVLRRQPVGPPSVDASTSAALSGLQLPASAFQVGQEQSFQVGGDSYAGQLAALPGGSYYLLATSPLSQLEQPLRDGLMLGLEVLLASLLVASLLGIALGRQIATPLAALAAASRRLAEGRYEHRLPESGPSEVREVSRAFNTMAQQLGELDQLKSDFIATAGHELRTPLTAIQGAVDVLLSQSKAGQRRDFLVMIERNNRRMTALVNALLDLSRLEAGRMSLDLREVRLQDVVAEAVEECRPWLERRRQRLVLQAAGEGRWVKADPLRLGRVIVNLLGNAGKFSPEGSTVTLSVEREARGAREGVSLVVEDEGPGLLPGDLERVFERFYRSGGEGSEDTSPSDGTAGLGLGLAIARGVVELHQGEISAANRPGGGARFTVWLPAFSSARPPKPSQAQPRKGAAAAAPTPMPRRA